MELVSVRKAPLGSGSPIGLVHLVLQVHGDLEEVKALLWRWTLQFGGLERLSWQFKSDVRHRQPQAEGVVRPSVALCFAVALALFWKLGGCNLKAWRLQFGGLEAAIWSWFLLGSQSNVRQYGPLPLGPFRPSGPCCLNVAEPSFRGLAAGLGLVGQHHAANKKGKEQEQEGKGRGAKTNKKAGESINSKNKASFL